MMINLEPAFLLALIGFDLVRIAPYTYSLLWLGAQVTTNWRDVATTTQVDDT